MTERAYRYRHVATLDETNNVGDVYFAHYLHWQGHCRERFLADHAPGVLAELLARQFVMVTRSCTMDYYAECLAFDVIDILMTPRSTSGNRIAMDFDLQRGEQLVARGTQTVACMRRSTDGVMPTEIPAELVRALRRFAPE